MRERRNPKRSDSRLGIPSGGSPVRNGDRKQRRREKRRDSRDVPFYAIFLSTGTVLAILCLVGHTAYRYFVPYEETPMDIDDDDVGMPVDIHEDVRDKDQVHVDLGDEGATPPPPTYPPLPTWNLTDGHDAYSLAKYLEPRNSSSNHIFWQVARGLRREFSEHYGGENSARAILERGLSTFPKHPAATRDEINSDLTVTACRIQRARAEKRPFRFSFGGYSVTLGRGNWFKQSFPLVMEKLLATAFSSLHVPLLVTNAAIGGCPAFPYGFCMSNFWGLDADVVSWDFSMNEAGGDARGFEAYLRHLVQLPRSPKLIVKDTDMAIDRRQLLRLYVDHGVLSDPVVVHSDAAARPFLDRPEDYRPTGFQDWRTFGAPLGAPGQAVHHPAVKEHQFNAWLLTMHFLQALELVAANDGGTHKLICPDTAAAASLLPLPPPLVEENANSTNAYRALFMGEPISTDKMTWTMNPIHCRTSFEPIVRGSLQSIRVSGTVGEDLDTMLPKSKMYYNQGWVYDLSDGEKQAKRKLDLFGGLGFVDSKQAYYGIYTSKTIRLLLPHEPAAHISVVAKAGDLAKDWFRSVLVCQVNEKRAENACILARDAVFHVDGHPTEALKANFPGSQYLGQDLCLYLAVPEAAKLTTRRLLQANETSDIVLPGQPDPAIENQVGLVVQARVNSTRIVRREQACSISHVIWEQRR